MDEFIEDLVLLKTLYRESRTGSVQDYEQEYRLYARVNPNGNIVGYALGESHCGLQRGCFWTEEEINSSSLEEFNSVNRALRN